MLENFERDLAIGREAEEIVREVFSSLDPEHTYENVGNNSLCYYRGDIKVVDKEGNVRYIEVKNDSRIAETRNVLCEEEVYYKKYDYYGKGNMQSDYDIYAVVSKEQREIYVLDFEVLKKNYRKGSYKEIEHPQQITYCFLLSIDELERLGGVIAVVRY